MKNFLMLLAGAALLLGGVLSGDAGTLAVTVTDDKGAPVADAVVYALAPGGPLTARAGAPEVVIEQKELNFTPWVTPVQQGSRVVFPNRDTVKHHVYSFSAVKRFEIPLYSGQSPEAVLFDKPGVVTMGCNIHDWMLAYVLVVPTPFFATTGADGKATLSALPPGSYRVEVWHPLLKGRPEAGGQTIAVATGRADAPFTVSLRPNLSRKTQKPDETRTDY